MCVCPGSEASIIVAVKQLERYPVDLYYLVDVSASMQENLDHVGVAVSVPLSESVLKYFTYIVLKGNITIFQPGPYSYIFVSM